MPLLLLCHDNTRCLCLCTSQLNFLLSTRSYQMKIREKYTIGMVKTDWRNVEAEIMTLSLGKIVELCNKKQCNVTQIYNHAWWHMHSFIYSIRSSLTSIPFFFFPILLISYLVEGRAPPLLWLFVFIWISGIELHLSPLNIHSGHTVSNHGWLQLDLFIKLPNLLCA